MTGYEKNKKLFPQFTYDTSSLRRIGSARAMNHTECTHRPRPAGMEAKAGTLESRFFRAASSEKKRIGNSSLTHV